MFKNLIAAGLVFSTALAEPTDQAVPNGNGVVVDSEILKLRRLVMDQQDKVDEHRKVLETIHKTKGIIYNGTQDAREFKEIETPEDEKNEKRYVRAVVRISEIDLDITRLDFMERDELIPMAADIKVEGNPFATDPIETGTRNKSDHSRAAPLDDNAKLGKLRGLLEAERGETMMRLHDIPMKRAIYVCADRIYENEKQKLELMKAALTRAETHKALHQRDKDSPKK